MAIALSVAAFFMTLLGGLLALRLQDRLHLILGFSACAVIAVARGGRLGLLDAIGYADSARSRPLRPDSVFSIFSVTKAITNVLALRAIELGRFALTTRVSDLVPEFSGWSREQIQIQHLLTHTSGLPIVFTVKPDMYIDRFDEVLAAVCASIRPSEPPGERVAYSPMANHVLLGEALRRTDPGPWK